MAFNGSGVFVRLYNWVNDAAANIKIRADRMDAEFNGIATGLTNCITKDGQTTVTANLPMAGFKHTNVANASSNNEYAAFGQIATAISAITFDNLSDVTITSSATGDFIVWNGTAWTNRARASVPLDGLLATSTSGIVLKNNSNATVLTIGASGGLGSTFAGALIITGAATLSSTLGVTGKTTTAASATGGSGLNIPHGVAPTSPVNGDIWTSTAGIFVHINGATQTLQGSLNRNYAEYSANTDLTTSIPYDDTIPQVTEGTQILSATITPKTTTNRVRARVVIAGAQSATANTYMGVALFRNGAADAIAAKAIHLVANSQGSHEAVLEFEHVPAATSLQTYTVRVGLSSGTLRLNGTASGRIYGGVQVCTMILEEIPV